MRFSVGPFGFVLACLRANPAWRIGFPTTRPYLPRHIVRSSWHSSSDPCDCPFDHCSIKWICVDSPTPHVSQNVANVVTNSLDHDDQVNIRVCLRSPSCDRTNYAYCHQIFSQSSSGLCHNSSSDFDLLRNSCRRL